MTKKAPSDKAPVVAGFAGRGAGGRRARYTARCRGVGCMVALSKQFSRHLRYMRLHLPNA